LFDYNRQVSTATATTTQTAPLRCAVYARISKDDGADELGVRRQERNCRDLIKRRGHQLVGVYVDNDRTASFGSKPRPEFERLRADVARGEVDLVVCQNQDRLTRDTVELEQLMRFLRSAGHDHVLTVATDRVGIKTTNERLGYRVKGLFDASYSEYISEKVKEHKDELALEGRPAGGGSRPYGYEDDKVTINPTEAAVVLEAAQRAAEGEPLYAIAADLNTRGVSTATGKQWSPNTLRGVITSPRVTGLRQHRGEVVGDATWPAIVPRDLWERARAVLTDPSRERRGRPARFLLTGLLVCGRCGATLMGGANNGKPAYACMKRPNWPGCGRLAIAAEPVEEHVIETALRFTTDAELVAGRKQHRAQAKTEEQRLRQALKDLKVRERRLVDQVVDLGLPRDVADRKAAELRQERERLTARLARVGKVIATVEFDQAHLRRIRQRWDQLTGAEKRASLRRVLEQVVIDPFKVRGRHAVDLSRVHVHPISWEVMLDAAERATPTPEDEAAYLDVGFAETQRTSQESATGSRRRG
jgi:site-specific DNA recombinase